MESTNLNPVLFKYTQGLDFSTNSFYRITCATMLYLFLENEQSGLQICLQCQTARNGKGEV